VAISHPADRIPAAIDVCRKVALPIKGRYEWARLVEFLPVKELYAFGFQAA